MADERDDAGPVVPEYRPPRDDARWTGTDRARAVVGGLLGVASVLGLVFLWIICAFASEGGGSGAGAIGVAVAVTAGVVVVIGGVARYQWVAYRSRAFLLGALVGVGVGLLIEGACFASMMGR